MRVLTTRFRFLNFREKSQDWSNEVTNKEEEVLRYAYDLVADDNDVLRMTRVRKRVNIGTIEGFVCCPLSLLCIFISFLFAKAARSYLPEHVHAY